MQNFEKLVCKVLDANSSRTKHLEQLGTYRVYKLSISFENGIK